MNEAVENLEEVVEDEEVAFALWREAMLKVAGIWEHRDDLPDFQEIRKSLDRNLWAR